ncbi:MAG: hypothetical protein ACK4N5_13615 [Myxococcales bacterium]
MMFIRDTPLIHTCSAVPFCATWRRAVPPVGIAPLHDASCAKVPAFIVPASQSPVAATYLIRYPVSPVVCMRVRMPASPVGERTVTSAVITSAALAVVTR